jgi:hypothetical protein
MATLGFVLAAVLDPVQAGIVLAVVLLYRGTLPVVVAGICAALVSETVMAFAAAGYAWGELILPRLISALVQAVALWWAVQWLRMWRSGGRRVLPPGSAAAPHD